MFLKKYFYIIKTFLCFRYRCTCTTQNMDLFIVSSVVSGCVLALIYSLYYDKELHKTHIKSKIKQPHIVYLTKNSRLQYLLVKGSSECPICLTRIDYQNKSYMAFMSRDAPSDNEPCATSCDHVMHYGCLRDWLNINPTCPVCRQTQRVKVCRVLRIESRGILSRIFGNMNTDDPRTDCFFFPLHA